MNASTSTALNDDGNVVVDSGVKSSTSPTYKYQYYYDQSVTPSTTLLLVVVGTSMTVSDYADIARGSVRGQSIVFCMVDNNPGSLTNPSGFVKLDGKKAAAAFNDIVSNLEDRFVTDFVPSPKIVVGGHSSGGSAAIDAMKIDPTTSTGLLNFSPAGYVGLDPYGSTRFDPSSNISRKSISIPSLAWGFTDTTCAVSVDEAGKAAYNVSPNTHRVFFQTKNAKERGSNQITHCIFSGNGCPACPSHALGAWMREAVANSVVVFVASLADGTGVAVKADYEGAIPVNDPPHDVRVFWNDDSTLEPP